MTQYLSREFICGICDTQPAKHTIETEHHHLNICDSCNTKFIQRIEVILELMINNEGN